MSEFGNGVALPLTLSLTISIVGEGGVGGGGSDIRSISRPKNLSRLFAKSRIR